MEKHEVLEQVSIVKFPNHGGNKTRDIDQVH